MSARNRSTTRGIWKRILVGIGFPIASLTLLRCSDSTGTEERLLRGADITLGQGIARTEVTLNQSGKPISIAVVLNAAALSGLPATVPQGGLEVVLPLPTDAGPLPFDHVAMNWQPGGHPPPGIYNRPHFDVHFYAITMAERNAMTPADPQFAAKALRAPAAEFVPPNYVTDGTAIPRMGSHWNDRNAPEHHGVTFTRTLIYGFFDGSMIFIEPMVTKEFLETHADVTADLAIPTRYPRPGFYPTRWRVSFDSTRGEHRIELSGFTQRQ